MTLTVNDLLQLLQRAADEGHGESRVEARNVAGDFDYLDTCSVSITLKRGGHFELRIDPSAE